jgi:hypothetical protein
MTFSTDGLIGVNLSSTGTTPIYAVGQLTEVSGGQRWMYVYASSAITQYDYVCIDEDSKVASGTKALVDAGYAIGFAQVAFAAAEYGWVPLEARGNANVRVAASCAADVALYTTASAGVLDDASSSQTQVKGVVIVTAVTAASNSEVIATFPTGV